VATSERPIPLPDPDPTPDLSLLQTLGDGAARFMPQAVAAAPVPGSRSVGTLGDRLMTLLPPSPELERLHIWPWYPIHDCRPDIVFTVEQDCGEGPVEIYRENALATRWNIPTTVDDIVLVANEDACCAPACEPDPPDGDCLAIHGPGCGGYSIDYVEQDPTDPLAGYYTFGSADVLFGGKIPIRGVFGDAAGVQYYKPQRRRLQPPAIPGAWEDVPADEVAVFVRRHWIGPPPPFWKSESVGLVTVNDPTAPGGQRQVLKTVGRYQAEDGDVVPGVPGRNHDMLFSWRTATQSSTGGGHQSGLPDGLYELRFLGYGYDQENDRLVDERVMPLCPAVGKEVDPNVHSTLLLSLDNRIWSTVAGSVHLDTQEPECDLVSVTVERSGGGTEAVAACGFARVKADDTIRIRFRASDADSHLGGFALTAHWGDGLVFDVLDAGSLTADGGSLLGRSYAEVIGDPGHVRPFWAGGTYEVAVVVGAPVPGSPHQAFGTCCAFQLDLRTWKRTTDGCTDIRHFHRNHCEYSFTVIRTDLIDHPDHPSCTSLCEEDD
ncbi:MAG: hypothetical protein MI919_12045, partial [Holophagales bacterium]|nr:hypothetical protein [Holophagales bacterium]